MPFKEASMQHPTSCGQNILDTQVNGPYTASNEKQVLINLYCLQRKASSYQSIYTASNEKQVLINNIDKNPDMRIYFKKRGEATYHKLTPEEFNKIKDDFKTNGRQAILCN